MEWEENKFRFRSMRQTPAVAAVLDQVLFLYMYGVRSTPVLNTRTRSSGSLAPFASFLETEHRVLDSCQQNYDIYMYIHRHITSSCTGVPTTTVSTAEDAVQITNDISALYCVCIAGGLCTYSYYISLQRCGYLH